MNTTVEKPVENQKIENYYICANKNVREDKNGNKFLLLRLMNTDGIIGAVKWRVEEAVVDSFDQGQVVKITGRVKKSNYRDQLEIDLENITPVTDEDEVDPASLQPASPRDMGEMEAELAGIRDSITNTYLSLLLDEIFTDDMYRAYCQAPAAKGIHHNYIHGLLEHSLSVSQVADAIAGQYQDINRDLLVTAAILHDIGKTVEFNYSTAIDYSDKGRLLGHIVIGEKIVADAISRLESIPGEGADSGQLQLEGGGAGAQPEEFPRELALQLLHLILSHHGEKEYGSPIRPKTPEAFILNHADDIDAKANIFERKRADSDDPWSEFNRPLDRFLYLRKAEDQE
ncbi:MAG: HD domain-containing protein [Thermoleophilia bacterium]|jgi:3'-5' exoribonuclease